MKYQDFALGGLLGFLLSLPFFLILDNFVHIPTFYMFYTLLFSFCFLVVSVVVFIFTIYNAMKYDIRIKDYEKQVLEEHERVKNTLTAFKQAICRQNNGYQQFSEQQFQNYEIIETLNAYIMLWVYKSSIGKLRKDGKEKAWAQIENAKQEINKIKKDPIKEREKINIDLNKKAMDYKKMESHMEKQDEAMPARIYCINCGQDLSCPSCFNEIRNGDFKYRKNDF